MADESPDDPARTSDADAREQEHERRNRLQAEIFRLAFDRARHAAFIEEALRRAGREREADESRNSSGY
jgi:hypothetical protein